jgi:triosephosphate isomerase (TIM)
MNGMPDAARSLAAEIKVRAAAAKSPPEILLCPPAPLLTVVGATISGSAVKLGAQDCHANEKGAHTGDTSAELLAAVGCGFVIVGHSERRTDHGETSALVSAKAQAALRAGITPIICLGETGEERDGGKAPEIIATQVRDSVPKGASADNVVIAYEPVWAIGTGRTATEGDIEVAHAQIRKTFSRKNGPAEELRILYGGSVKGSNAASVLRTPGVNGALVGGASLKADDFWSIIEACP